MTIWHSVILEERAVKPPEPSPHSFYEVSPADLSNYYRGSARQIGCGMGWANNIAIGSHTAYKPLSRVGVSRLSTEVDGPADLVPQTAVWWAGTPGSPRNRAYFWASVRLRSRWTPTPQFI